MDLEWVKYWSGTGYGFLNIIGRNVALAAMCDLNKTGKGAIT
jgi:hypothetical protein